MDEWWQRISCCLPTHFAPWIGYANESSSFASRPILFWSTTNHRIDSRLDAKEGECCDAYLFAKLTSSPSHLLRRSMSSSTTTTTLPSEPSPSSSPQPPPRPQPESPEQTQTTMQFQLVRWAIGILNVGREKRSWLWLICCPVGVCVFWWWWFWDGEMVFGWVYNIYIRQYILGQRYSR